jgi:uncharacterized RDD family membrane protein YckC
MFRGRYVPGGPGFATASVVGVAEQTDPADGPTAGTAQVTFGLRLGAFVVDSILADLFAIIVNGGYHVGGRQNLSTYVAFLLIEIVFVTLAGQTPGMRVAGIAVIRDKGIGRPGIRWVLLRTLLLAVIVPALIVDSAGRAMHDRAAGLRMVRTRG